MSSNLMNKTYDNPRIVAVADTNAWQGRVKWNAGKSLWISAMTSIGVLGALVTLNLENFVIFLFSSAITLCLGHSLGMHRRFIHHSYECPKFLEYLFVYFGVLVGLAGPMGMMHTHDLRDWAQRQKRCHPYFGHKTSMLKDAFWQMHCDIILKHPPEFRPEQEVAQDVIYQWLERTWMWQQLPVALFFYYVGGVEWVIWGVCLRVAVSITGHWFIGHFAHNMGHREWHVEGAAVQGFNIQYCGLITMGECWHNNHHAFPNSALLGIHAHQTDPGWWILRLLEKIGMVWSIKTPENIAPRDELVALRPISRKTSGLKKLCGIICIKTTN